MLKLKNTKNCLRAVLFLTALCAGASQAGEIETRVAQIKNPVLNKLIGQAASSCQSGRWAECQMAIFDAKANGMRRQEDPTTGSIYHASGDAFANLAWKALFDAMGTEKYYNDFFIAVDPIAKDSGGTILIYNIENELTRAMAFQVIGQHIRAARIPYNESLPISTKRGEWLRMVALGYMARGNTAQAYQAISLLIPYARGSGRDAWTVTQTRNAVIKYAEWKNKQRKNSATNGVKK